MDPATVIALCKENIQPLRYGRNVAQLGAALRAQEDADAQQLLLQEKQIYEDAIKNYEGDDPLENWYEYILWVEQSYPRNGHESLIEKLLQQCLATFEKETKYHQDRRYIRLWINYISMQKNTIELYQLLYNNGIGTMVADMYRAWAFELEQMEDYKRADEIYMMGMTAHAEPQYELECAHRNLQVVVGRKILGHTDDRSEVSLFEQRQAFSSLKAIKAGRKVGSIRTGHRVRDHYPGAIPQISAGMQNTKPNSRIQIYQDDAPSEIKASILDHVPVEDVHKENTIKPGPWNSGAKKCPLMTASVKTAFKVHEDQLSDHDMEKLRLFPNHTSFFDGSKYSEHTMVPVYVPDAPGQNIFKPHYPKELVYADNVDRSMEEIKAQIYIERKKQQVQEMSSANNEMHTTPKSFEPEHQSHDMMLHGMQRHEFSRQEIVERQRNLEQQRREAEQLKLGQQRLQAEREFQRQQYEAENQALQSQRHQAEQRELQRLESKRLEAERLEAERIEAQRMEAELNSHQKIPPPNYMHHSSGLSAEPEEHLLGQSLTVNMKEAMSMVLGMWDAPLQPATTPRIRSPVAPRMNDSRAKLPFDIHMDGSMTQHAMSNSKHHPGYNVPPYNDQENHQNYPPVHQDYPNHQEQIAYTGHGLQNTYHYQMQQHQEQMQPSHPRPHHQPSHASSHQPLPETHHIQMHPRNHMIQELQHHQPHIQQHHHHQSPHNQHVQHQHQSPHSPHIQHPHQSLHSPHVQHQHQSPHNQHVPHQHQHQQQHQHHIHQQHMQHMQHPVYGNMLPNDMGYQQYSSTMEPAMLPQNIEPQKQVHFMPYSDQDVEPNKPYRMPPELPYIKSPGMNRRDLKYLESTEDKENAVVTDYNGPIEENMVAKSDENNLYIDESLGINPLSETSDTCFTEAFNTQLASSTPMSNHFKAYRTKDSPQFPSQSAPSQTIPEVPNVEGDDKLSIILESTREYISSSSGSSAHTRTTGLGFTLTREDMVPIKEECEQNGQDRESASNETLSNANQAYDQKIHIQVHAVHAQSPRTMQRNVDQITSEIKTNCDLRKSISFKLNSQPDNEQKPETMECEVHEPMEQIEEEKEQPYQLPSGEINPFDKTLIAGLLKNIKFPQPHHAEGYVRLDTNLNKLVASTTVTFGSDAYDLETCLGKGMYGTVFKAISLQTGETVALKMQKPAWVWEFYIAREIKARITNPHMLHGFMDVSAAYVANNGSVLVTKFSKYGTLLAVTNQVKIASGKPLQESLSILFTIEMLQIVEHLHKCRIIHGDIKPDNFLLMRLPTEDVRPTIQLIDFGCSIDMSLLPESTTFNQIIKTEDFTCIEMQTGRPWTYQTDLYCLAATSHCLLFGNYMRVSNVGGRWFINSKLPRYIKKPLWEQFFTELLNIESCEKMPDLSKLRMLMEENLAQCSSVSLHIRSFSNTLNKR